MASRAVHARMCRLLDGEGAGGALRQSVPDRRTDRPRRRTRVLHPGMAGGRDPVVAGRHHALARPRFEDIAAMERIPIGLLERSRRCTQTVAATLPGAFLFLTLCSGGAFAQGAAHPSSEPALSSGYKFVQTTGRDLFANICQ